MGESLKAHILAVQITKIAVIVKDINLDDLKEAADDMIKQVNWQDSAAALLPSNLLEKNDLLRTMGSALLKLHEYIMLLKKIDEGKAQVAQAEMYRNQISNMFM